MRSPASSSIFVVATSRPRPASLRMRSRRSSLRISMKTSRMSASPMLASGSSTGARMRHSAAMLSGPSSRTMRTGWACLPELSWGSTPTSTFSSWRVTRPTMMRSLSVKPLPSERSVAILALRCFSYCGKSSTNRVTWCPRVKASTALIATAAPTISTTARPRGTWRRCSQVTGGLSRKVSRIASAIGTRMPCSQESRPSTMAALASSAKVRIAQV